MYHEIIFIEMFQSHHTSVDYTNSFIHAFIHLPTDKAIPNLMNLGYRTNIVKRLIKFCCNINLKTIVHAVAAMLITF